MRLERCLDELAHVRFPLAVARSSANVRFNSVCIALLAHRALVFLDEIWRKNADKVGYLLQVI